MRFVASRAATDRLRQILPSGKRAFVLISGREAIKLPVGVPPSQLKENVARLGANGQVIDCPPVTKHGSFAWNVFFYVARVPGTQWIVPR